MCFVHIAEIISEPWNYIALYTYMLEDSGDSYTNRLSKTSLMMSIGNRCSARKLFKTSSNSSAMRLHIAKGLCIHHVVLHAYAHDSNSRS